MWSTATITPLERVPGAPDFLTEEQAAELERRAAAQDQNNTSSDRDAGITGVPTRRTSLVIDPPDGRVPIKPEAQRRLAALADAQKTNPADNPEDRPLWERCITVGVPMVMLPQLHNSNYRIVQTPTYVVIEAEMIHDARIIPVDARPHLPSHLRQWLGDSVGHWEGDTLVVVTTNFTDKTNFWGSAEKLRLIERFMRTSPDLLLYQVTVLDRTTFSRPWTIELPVRRTDGQIYEYACHEGNYALESILRGARANDHGTAAR